MFSEAPILKNIPQTEVVLLSILNLVSCKAPSTGVRCLHSILVPNVSFFLLFSYSFSCY